MPSNIVVTAAQLTQWIRTEFADAYKLAADGLGPRIDAMMQRGIPSNALTEFYGYFEAAPYPRRWPRGTNITSENFLSQTFSVVNYDWGRRVPWHRNDRRDDRTQSLLDQARSCGEHWATLDERVFFQIVRAAADVNLLPAIPNAPDGAVLYATTAGGAARFGVTGGNLITGNGVAAAQTIRNDFYEARSRFRRFQDQKGQPLFSESILDAGYIVIFGAGNEQAFAEAFYQQMTIGAVGVAPVTAVSNIVKDQLLNVTLVPTQRITDNDWFIFLKGSPKKPIFSQEREPLRESFATEDNSDHARDSGEEYAQWASRRGYGVGPAYGTIEVNN